MPSYMFKCDKCENVWTEILGFNEKPEECPKCKSSEFKKQHDFSSLVVNVKQESLEKKKAGTKIRTHIEEMRQELKEYKAEIKK